LAGPIAFFLVLDTRRRLSQIEHKLAQAEPRRAAPIDIPGAAPAAEGPPPASSPPPEEQVAPEATREPPLAEPARFPPAYAQWPSRPAADVEEQLGTRWAVWVGGIALALGGLLLVVTRSTRAYSALARASFSGSSSASP
jgi:uncharacterized membrane protein